MGTMALQRSCNFGSSDSPETMRQDELKKWFSNYAEFPEGSKLRFPLDIPVLNSFQLRGGGAKALLTTWPQHLPLDSHYRGYIPFSSNGSAAFGCTHYWHTSEITNKFQLHRWQWRSAGWNRCYKKWKCHWILSVYLCGIGISLKRPYICLCP